MDRGAAAIRSDASARWGRVANLQQVDSGIEATSAADNLLSPMGKPMSPPCRLPEQNGLRSARVSSPFGLAGRSEDPAVDALNPAFDVTDTTLNVRQPLPETQLG